MLIPREQIDRAKELLPIPVLWRLLNLPGEPGKTGQACHSPFREDRHASFAIYDGGKTAFDFTTGQKYDGPSVLAEARGLSIGQALKDFVELAGGDAGRCEHVSLQKQSDSQYQREVLQRRPDLSRFRMPSKAELLAIASDRGLAIAAPIIAARLGCVKCGNVCGFASWILVDRSGLIGEARRFGREDFPPIGDIGRRKAHRIRGSVKSWPLGLGVDRSLIEKASLLAVCEGGPDWLAAWHFIYRAKRWDVFPVSILGRCVHGLHYEALELLKGKRIKFFPHADPDDGALKQIGLIGEQLRMVGCQLSYFDLAGLRTAGGKPAKDLNDLASLDATQLGDLFYAKH
jgi:hypothetical protein